MLNIKIYRNMLFTKKTQNNPILLFFFFFFITLSSSSCKTKQNSQQQETEIKELIYGTHFGHCRGICRMELHFTPNDSWFSTSGNDTVSNPEQIEPRDWDKTLWKKLTENFPQSEFTEENKRIGCPDCADGGEEYIEITTKNSHSRVTFEFGTEQVQLNPLLTRLRAMMKKEMEDLDK